jgi:hypothetical protein
VKWAVLHRFGLIQVGLVSEQGHIAFIAPRSYGDEVAAESVAAHMNVISPSRTADVHS